MTAVYLQGAQPSPPIGGSRGQARCLPAVRTSHSLTHVGRCTLSQPAPDPSCAALRVLVTNSLISDPSFCLGAAWWAGDRGTSVSWLTDEPHGLPPQGLLRAL